MKFFIKKTLVFLSIPLLFIFFIDIFLRNQNSLYKEKFEGAIQDKEDIQIVILGNSHAHYGVDPKSFNSYAFNLANLNQSLYFDKRITLSLLDDLKQLKYVLISVDHHSFYFSDQGIRNVWSYYGTGIKYEDQSYFLENISPFLFGYPPKVTLSIFKKRLENFIFYRNKGSDIYLLQDGVNPLDSVHKGFIGYEGIDENCFSTKSLKRRANIFDNKYKNKAIKGNVIRDLEDFIKELKENGVTPVLFTSPTYSEYNVHLEQKNISSNKEDIEKIRRNFDLIYWDFMDSPTFSKEDFYDGDHLNKNGAAKFGRILNDSIEAIAKKDTNPK